LLFRKGRFYSRGFVYFAVNGKKLFERNMLGNVKDFYPDNLLIITDIKDDIFRGDRPRSSLGFASQILCAEHTNHGPYLAYGS